MKDAEAIFLKFIEQINMNSVDGLCDLMSDDHKFIDALGSVIQGREAMRHGWKGYFGMVPDYWISIEEMIVKDNIVAAFGTAGGTYCPDGTLSGENKWQAPAAWRAVVSDNVVAEWRVYVDNEPVRQLMAKARKV